MDEATWLPSILSVMPVTATLSVPDAVTETVPVTVEAVGAVTVAVGAVVSEQPPLFETQIGEDHISAPLERVTYA